MLTELRRTATFFQGHSIARTQKLATWRRYLSWQLRSRLFPGPKVMAWLEDAVLVVESGMTGATGNLYCGLHEFADMAFVLHFLDSQGESSGYFLDVGANVGAYSVLASRICGVRTIAIEPGEAAFKGLARNIEANRIESLVCAHPVAAGSEAGVLRFSIDRDTPMNQIVGDDYLGKTVSVPVATIDKILDGYSVSLIKLDVEGHEAAVLRGAAGCLHNPLTMAMLVEADDIEVANQLRDAGFVRVDYDPTSRCTKEVDGDRMMVNHLWVRDPDQVTEMCRAARRFKVFGYEF